LRGDDSREELNVMADDKQRIDALINRGLLDQWYAVAKSVQVKPGAPHAVKALGRNLVLWRDTSGQLHCLEDYCPHRGARLSRGEVLGDNIACRYHGVTLDGSGTVVRVPAMPGCALEGRRPVESFAVAEANDAIFIYFASAEHPEPAPLTLPEEFLSPEWTGILCVAAWECNYRFALDNVADPMHGCYLHANSFTLAFGAKHDQMRIERTPRGFIVSRVEQQGENFDWTEMVTETAAPYCRLDIPYPAAAGPGGPFRIIGFITPVDEENCLVFFWRLRKVQGLAREVWRFLYRATLEERHWHVLEQDRDILVSLPADAHRREMLYQHDIGVARLRQALINKAKAQLAARDAAAARDAG
jgi:phenylpropionate dioxygenase-like ring-hydroxylating dioxygenase large terminal subunit